MIQEIYKDYIIIANPKKTINEKWKVSTIIQRNTIDGLKKRHFTAEDNIEYILEIEAAKESINLGKNLIKKNMIGF